MRSSQNVNTASAFLYIYIENSVFLHSGHSFIPLTIEIHLRMVKLYLNDHIRHYITKCKVKLYNHTSPSKNFALYLQDCLYIVLEGVACKQDTNFSNKHSEKTSFHSFKVCH